MLSFEEVVTRITSVCSDLTREEALKLIYKKKEELRGLLTEEGAAYMVANDLGINLSQESVLNSKIRINDLIVGLRDVTLTGRVLSVQSVRTFTRKDGVKGRVGRLVIADATDVLNVVLWNEHTEIVDQGQINQNQIIRVSHGYVRNGIDGKPELNVGTKGIINIDPNDVDHNDYPQIKDFYKKISEISEEDKYFNLFGVVKYISPTTIFKKSDGGTGQVKRINLTDETGEIIAVFWNNKAEEAKKLKPGNSLEIIGARIRRGLQDLLEIHIGKSAKIKVFQEKKLTRIPTIKFLKIDEIRPNLVDINILARVIYVSQIREFKRPSGKTGQVVNLLLKDETGSVRIALWDEKTNLKDRIELGDIVLFEGVYSRSNLKGVDLNLGREGTITVDPPIPETKLIQDFTSKIKSINQLEQGCDTVNVEGTILERPITREVMTKWGKRVKVSSFRIRDHTGEVRVSFWKGLAEKVEGLQTGTGIRVLNANIQIGLDGKLELSSVFSTSIKILS
jgi:replication factor A1